MAGHRRARRQGTQERGVRGAKPWSSELGQPNHLEELSPLESILRGLGDARALWSRATPGPRMLEAT